MDVIKVSHDQWQEIFQLSMYAFQYDLSDKELEEKRHNLKEHQILGIYENNQLAAKLHIRPFQVYQRSEPIKMGGIASVSTYPEYRRRGYVKQLLLASLEEMRKNGQLLSMLHPFSISFYRKFGYEIFSENIRVQMKQADLIPINSDKIGGKIIRLRKEQFHEALHDIYDAFAQSHSGMLVRSKEWWQKSVLKNVAAAIYFGEKGEPLGYLLYDVKERRMEVKEFIILQHEARTELWRFVCQHDSMIDTLTMNINKDEPLLYTLKNPQVKTELTPYFMTRIVDVEAYLLQYPFQIQSDDSLQLHIEDPYAPWNEGVYEISRQSIKKVRNVSEQQREKCLTLTINALTALLLGYQTAQQLSDIGEILGPIEQVLELAGIVPKQSTYFPDFF
ncbi:GNAT family N-acetyltransferase [Bacillus sp. FJAT-50079]|uniref:GNAT family N-acetyltransferase n=1 Tax=Bacillus sp. FJAT-50079 TaxID=2833577 RepID=UPI001BCA5AAF|nr:GNAT family N-acetyltransferase [Bacillus sp. FJAT-50079]MBS4207748.1 GNAT family N-acetyltransferase [Bacillus sp. FJAT-50079]